MKKLALLALLLSVNAFAFGKKAPAPAPSPTVTATPAPAPTGPVLVAMGDDIGPSVDRAVVVKALALMNQAFASGCLERQTVAHKFESLHNIAGSQVRTNAEAYKRFVAGAPYKLNVRWYYKKLTNTIGYTYTYLTDSGGGPKGASETRVWTNTKYITGPTMLAKHYAHELSHQARAGGFVHYTIHQGSFPYEIGDVMGECLPPGGG